MTDTAQTTPGLLLAWAERVLSWYQAIPGGLIGVLARIAVFGVFWSSARTKVDGLFHIADKTYFLFKYEYQVPLIPSDFAAVMATISEHVFSVLVLIGLATRLSATALMVMTLVIQLFVYPEAWQTHIFWAVALLYLMARGPGALSVDHVIRGRIARP